MITTNLSTLKIHKLTQAQYERELAAGNIDETALYLIPDEELVQNISTTATLYSSNWSNSTQTVAVRNVTSSSAVIVTPAPINYIDYSEAEIYCSAQRNGSLTFTCAEVPKTNLLVNILILN